MSLPKERIYLGYPCEFQDICLIYPALIGDILRIGYSNFQLYYSFFSMTAEDVQDLYVKLNIDGDFPTPFMHLLIMSQLPDVSKQIEEAFKFFIHDKVYFLYDSAEIVIGDIQEKHIINEDNYLEFQNAIRASLGDKEDVPLDQNLHPKLLRMKAKQRERDRVKAKQAAKKGGCSFANLMLSTCCLGVGATVFNIEKMSYAAMMQLHTFCADKDKYETDVASLLAGADSKKINLEYWVKD